MILVDLEITDYKQFAGTHRFSPTPNGVVAVIGTNGAGKTTLFEAIEWCLFQPREIANAEVPPRGGSDRTRVVLTLHDPRTGETHTVERSLRNGVGKAEVSRGQGDDRAVVVTGTRPVTEHVWRSLIGLDHRAFVATFFTRQKELSFFGASRPTERRREVQRLLGLETIRKAQETLSEERRAASSQAEALLLQVAETTQSRDFDADLTEATAAVAAARTAVEQRRAALNRADLDLQSAGRAVDEQTERQRQDAALAADLARLTAERDHAAKAAAAAEAELARLADLAETRDAANQLAATASDALARVDALEVERSRHQRLIEADRDIASARDLLAADLDQIRRLVSASPHHDLPAWRWPEDPHDDPTIAIDTLVASTAALDIEGRERRIGLLESARDRSAQAIEAAAEVDRIRAKLTGLHVDLDSQYSNGDPEDEIAHIDARERELDAEVQQRRTTVRLIGETIADLRALLERLSGTEPTGDCPACGRPFTAHDARDAEAHTRTRLADNERHVAELDREVATLLTRRAGYAGAKTAARARLAEVQTLRSQIGKGEGALSTAEETLTTRRSAEADALARLDAPTPPTDAEITVARRTLAAERAVAEAATAIKGRRTAVAGHLARIAEGENAKRDVGEVTFEPSALTVARHDLQSATSAAARVAEIDRELARIPEHVATRDEQSARRVTAVSALADTDRSRETLAFQPSALADARMDRDDAGDDQRAAQAQLTKAQLDHQAASTLVQQVERDREAHAALARRADDRARERDVLDDMVKEFNQFDRFVTQRVRPQMEDLTSELVRIVTDDKYTEVTLDDDYGVHIHDGAEGIDGAVDRFPLEQFSGGERDVVALCARLALSRIIGAQAVNPPRFLVLDEVFGSLDRERRLNLLEMLSNLTGSADVFQQLFVISHLDDVRTSPAFNEVWRVVEQGDGTSRLENLNLTGGSEEL